VASALDQAQVSEAKALATLWCFVKNLGLDPVRVIEAHDARSADDHRSMALVSVEGTVHGVLAQFVRPDAAATLGFERRVDRVTPECFR
jgi:hypothetical protein